MKAENRSRVDEQEEREMGRGGFVDFIRCLGEERTNR